MGDFLRALSLLTRLPVRARWTTTMSCRAAPWPPTRAH